MRLVLTTLFHNVRFASGARQNHTLALLPLLLGTIAVAFLPLPVGGFFSGTPISLTTIGSTYPQDFNTLAITGTTNTLAISGWALTENGGGTRDNEQYAADNGGSSTGDTYSYGAIGNNERALGGLRSGTLIPIIGACFTNNTGQPVTKLTISYTGEQWRLGATGRGADRLDFQYSTNAASVGDTMATWIDVNSLDFSSPTTTGATGPLDGNVVANRTTITFTITGLNVVTGTMFFIRWQDFDVTSSDDGLAVDDFSLTPETSPPPPTITMSPQSQTACAGQMASFSVAATGIAPLGYQWRKNGMTITGATSSSYAIAAVTAGDEADYDVIVSDVNGSSTSSSAHLTVATTPTVTAHPSNQLVAPGTVISFTAAASGTAPIATQWQASTDGGTTWNNIAGATMTALTLPPITLSDNGKRVRAQFTNACGTANSNSALLTVLPAEAKIMDPLVCIGDGSTLNVRAEIQNTSNVVVDGVFRAQLGAGLVTRNSSCVITGNGSCSFTGDDRVRWSELLQPGERVVIEYQVQVVPGQVTGAPLCITSTFEFNAGAVASVQACTKVNCPMVAGGGDLPNGVVANNSRPGSVLFFPYYASDLTRPQQENTRFTFTNTEGARGVTLHLFFVSADDCRVADTFLCLTAGQTTSLLASEYDPGERGFLVAVAVDGRTGCPINFNYLIGSEYLKLLSGHATNLNAFSIAAMTGGPAACDPGETTARLSFNGTDYTLVPRILAVNNIQSPVDDNNTLLILNRIGGNYSTGTATRLADLWGFVYDDAERGYSFQFDPTGCQYVRRIFDGAPRISPPITKVIPRGRTGWMRIQHLADSAMFGAVINLNPTGFSHGHMLHALSYTDASITIPIIPPVCGQ